MRVPTHPAAATLVGESPLTTNQPALATKKSRALVVVLGAGRGNY